MYARGPRSRCQSGYFLHPPLPHLILPDKADFLFSPYSSSLTATAAIVTEQYEKIMLTTGAAEGKTYTLTNQWSKDSMEALLAALAAKFGDYGFSNRPSEPLTP